MNLFSALTHSRTAISMDEDDKQGKNSGSTTQHKLAGLSFEEKNCINKFHEHFSNISLVRGLIFGKQLKALTVESPNLQK